MIDKRMLKAMKRMGIKLEVLKGVKRVVIEGETRDIIIESPNVVLTRLGGQQVFQVTGEVKQVEKARVAEIPEEDVELVAEQAGVSLEEARKALEKTGGDIASAIIELKKEKKG